MPSKQNKQKFFASSRFVFPLLLTIICTVFALPPALAQGLKHENKWDNWSISGFGTLAATRSSSAHAEFLRDLSQPSGAIDGQWTGRTDSVLGLQLNWQPHPEWEVVAQVASHFLRGRSSKPQPVWGFLKWEPHSSTNSQWMLRTGRIGADFLMHADSRLVGYSYVPVRPSVDFFAPVFFAHFDGVDLSHTRPVGGGILTGKIFAGRTHERTAGTRDILNPSGSRVAGAVLEFTKNAWTLRMNLTELRFGNEINSMGIDQKLHQIANSGAALGLSEANRAQALKAARSLSLKDSRTQFFSLGLVYDQGPLLVQATVNRIHNSTDVFESSRAGYIILGYRFGAWMPYVGASRWKSQNSNFTTGLPLQVASFGALEQAYRTFMSASRADQNTFTVGTRWDFERNWALKVQLDAVRGKPHSRFGFANSDSAWSGKTNVFTVALDFVF